MATKNLVPRASGEGSLGTSTKKWGNASFVSGSFDNLKSNKLQNIAGQELFQADDSGTVTITYDDSNNVYKLASTSVPGGVSSFWDLSEIKSLSADVSANQIVVYDDTGDPDTTGFYTRSVTGDVTIDNTGKILLDKTLFLSTRTPALTQLTSTDVVDTDRLLICDFDTTTESNSSLKYITKGDLFSGFTTTFVGLSDTSSAWQNGNLVKAVVVGSDVSFEADENSYLTAMDFSGLSTTDLPSDVLLSSALPSTSGIMKINVDTNNVKTITHITDNSANWDSAYSWGDHSASNYVKNDGTVHFSLSQDIQLNTANGGPFTITNVPLPTAGNDIASKTYVDSVATGLSLLEEVRCATTGPITRLGEQTIDSTVSVVAGDRVLVKNQGNSVENGIYVCAIGAWTRAADFNTGDQVSGSYTFIKEGSLNSKKGFVCTSNSASDTVGTHDITWAQFSSAGDFTSGSGLKLSNSGTFSLDLNEGLTDIALNDQGAAVVKSNDVIPIKDTSNDNSTNTVTIDKFITDLTDNSSLEKHNDTTSNTSKIRIKDEGVTLSKIAKLNQNKLLGNLSTAETTGSVAEITVSRESSTNNGQINVDEWTTASDQVVSTQASIRNYVDSKVSEVEDPPIKIGGTPSSDIKQVVELHNLNGTGAVMSGSYDTWINKTYHIKLRSENDSDHFWEQLNRTIRVRIPQIINTGTGNDTSIRTEVQKFIGFGKFYLLFDWSQVTQKFWYNNPGAKTPEILIEHNNGCGMKNWVNIEYPAQENVNIADEATARDSQLIGSFSVISDPAAENEFMIKDRDLTTNIRLPFRPFSENQWLNTKALYECGLSLHRFNWNESVIKGWSLILKVKRIS